MNDAFEDAFYQLDQDRDGVVTLDDLKRYVVDHNLKDKFIQKWLNLFADERNIIYYEKFCETLGIVPALDKFEQITYRIDMTEETKGIILDLINEYREKDKELSENTLNIIKDNLAQLLGDKWKTKINPTKDDVNTTYAPDGLLYYSPNQSGEPKILVFREMPETINKFEPLTYRIDMTEETKGIILDLINEYREKDEELSENTLNIINDNLEHLLGDEWKTKINPTTDDVNTTYAPDGLLYYSPNQFGEPKILVFREMPETVNKDNKDIIHESVMSDSVKEDVLEIFHRNYNPNIEIFPKSEKIINELNKNHGMMWNILINPSKIDIYVEYDFDGKLYFTPKSNDTMKILIWRKDKQRNRGNICFCCC